MSASDGSGDTASASIEVGYLDAKACMADRQRSLKGMSSSKLLLLQSDRWRTRSMIPRALTACAKSPLWRSMRMVAHEDIRL